MIGGNPEPLKLYGTLQTITSSLVAPDNAFAMEVGQIYKQINIKTNCNDISLLTTIILLEVELSNCAQEEEKRQRQKEKGQSCSRLFASIGQYCRKLPEMLLYQASRSRLQETWRVSTSLPTSKGEEQECPFAQEFLPIDCRSQGLNQMERRSLTLPQTKVEGKAKPKASASPSSSTQATHVLMWAEDPSMEAVDETLPSASLATHVDVWSYSARAFYATFTPAFRSSEPTNNQPLVAVNKPTASLPSPPPSMSAPVASPILKRAPPPTPPSSSTCSSTHASTDSSTYVPSPAVVQQSGSGFMECRPAECFTTSGWESPVALVCHAQKTAQAIHFPFTQCV